MRITVLTHAESEGDREVDIAVTQVAGALRERGHEVTSLSIYGDLEQLVAGLTRRPSLRRSVYLAGGLKSNRWICYNRNNHKKESELCKVFRAAGRS